MKKLAIYSVLFSTTLFAQTSDPQVQHADPRPIPVFGPTITPLPPFTPADYFAGKPELGVANVADVKAAVSYLNNNALNSMVTINPIAVDRFIVSVLSNPPTSALRSTLLGNLNTDSVFWLSNSATTLTSKMQPTEFNSLPSQVLATLAPVTLPEKALQVIPSLSPENEHSFLKSMIPASLGSTDSLARLITSASDPQNPDEAKGAFSVFTTILGDSTFNAYVSSVQAAKNSIQDNTFFTPDQKKALIKLIPPPNASDTSLFVPTQKNSAIPRAGSSKAILPKP